MANTVEVLLRLVDKLTPDAKRAARGVKDVQQGINRLNKSSGAGKIQRDLRGTAGAASKAAAETRQLSGSIKGLERRRLRRLSRQFEGVRRRVRETRREVTKLGQSAQTAGAGLRTIITGASLAFAAFAGVRVIADFEFQMNRVQALTGATIEQFETLNATAREMGATTQFSAGQAAEALGFLAQAGGDAVLINKQLPTALELAASAGTDLATAADIVTNIMAGYNLEASELTRVNDVLVKTFTSANTDLIELSEAMKLAAPVAASAGLEFEEVSAAMGLLGNAGLKATIAGTSIRGAIVRLLKPSGEAAEAMERLGISATDSAGKLLPLTEIVRQLEPVADQTGDIMTIFGLRAGPAMAALASQGTEALVNLRDELRNSGGTAAEIAEVQMRGLRGEFLKLKSAAEELALAIGEAGVLEALTKFTKGATTFVQAIGALPQPVLSAATSLIALAGAILGLGVLRSFFRLVVSQAGKLIKSVGGLGTAFTFLKNAVLFLTPPLRILLGIITALGAAFAFFGGEEEKAQDASEGLVQSLDQQAGKIKENLKQLREEKERLEERAKVLETIGNATGESSGEMENLQSKLDAVNREIEAGEGFLDRYESGMSRVATTTEEAADALLRLRNPSLQSIAALESLGVEALDAEGNIKSIGDIISQLDADTLTAGEALAAFGEDLGFFIFQVAQGGGQEGLDELSEKLKNLSDDTQTARQEIQAAISETVSGGALGDTIELSEELEESLRKVREQFEEVGVSAGVTLSNLTERLKEPTDDMVKALENMGVEVTDVDGNIRSLNQIIAQLTPLSFNAADATEAFGAEMAGVLQHILDEGGPEAIQEFAQRISNIGSASVGTRVRARELVIELGNLLEKRDELAKQRQAIRFDIDSESASIGAEKLDEDIRTTQRSIDAINDELYELNNTLNDTKEESEATGKELKEGFEEPKLSLEQLIGQSNGYFEALQRLNQTKLDQLKEEFKNLEELTLEGLKLTDASKAEVVATTQDLFDRRIALARAESETLTKIAEENAQRNKGLIANRVTDEAEAREQIITIERDLLDRRIQIKEQQLDTVREVRDQAVREWQKYANEVSSLEQKLADTRRDFTQSNLDFERRSLTDQEAFQSRINEIRRNDLQIERQLMEGNFELAANLARRNLQLSNQLQGEVQNEQGETIVTEQESAKIAMEGRLKAQKQIVAAIQQEKQEAEQAAQRQEQFVQTLDKAVTTLTDSVKSLSDEGVKFEVNLDKEEIDREIEQLKSDTFSTHFIEPDTTEIDKTIKKLEDTVITTKVRFESITGGGFASGGLIQGSGTGTSDSVPIMASNREYMVRAAAVRKYGVGFMHAINSMRFPKMPGFGAGMENTPVVRNRRRYAGGGLIDVDSGGSKVASRERQTIRIEVGGRSAEGEFSRDQADNLADLLEGLSAG